MAQVSTIHTACMFVKNQTDTDEDLELRAMATHRHDTPTTRRELVDSARALFTEAGFAAARTEEIVARTGLTRGALYHHFKNKEALFVAVLEQIHAELAAEVDRKGRAAKGGAIEALRAGFQAHLDVVLRDDVRRILLIDGPAVVGWDTWHAIDLEHGFGVTRAVLSHAMTTNEIDVAPLDELTHVLLGAVTQAGLELGRSPNPRTARRNYRAVIDLMLNNLRSAPRELTPAG